MSVPSNVLPTLVSAMEALLKALTQENGSAQWTQVNAAKAALDKIKYDTKNKQIDLGQNDTGADPRHARS